MTPDLRPPAPETRDRLERVLGPWLATALLIGNIIGSGVFKKPAAVAQSVPTTGAARGDPPRVLGGSTSHDRV